MKHNIEHVKSFQASEVKLSYVTNKNPSERVKINSSEDAASLLFEIWDKDTIEHSEEVKIILMNRDNRVLGIATISKGGLSGSVIDTRIIMQYVIKSNACAVILAHNHPSGSLKASEADKNITRKINDALKLFDVAFLDHLIITKSQYVSIIEF